MSPDDVYVCALCAEVFLMDRNTIAKVAGIAGMPDADRLNDLRMAIERRIIRHMLRELYSAGWYVSGIDDGGDELVTVRNQTEAHHTIFSVDESRVFFKRRENAGVDDSPQHGVFIIAGEGWSLITDWSYTHGDPDGFNALMESACDYAEKFSEVLD